MRAPSQRSALGILFLALAAAFGATAVAAGRAGVWVIAIAAGVLALWLAGLSRRALVRR